MRAGLIVLTVFVCANFAQAAGSRARLAAALAIFVAELAAEKTLGPCLIDGDAWMEYAVPVGLARKYLRLRAHEDVAPVPPPPPIATLDPDGARREVFCSKQESRARRDAAVATLRPGERTVHLTLGYAFPVFDAAVHTAIVIVGRDVNTWHRGDGGSDPRSSGEMFGIAHVYRKRGDRWDLIVDEEVYSGLY
ncbi:hypothetical protein [Bradyrhizobium sp. B117]|uniref:hypothetical protein n=1 Tax=Bradyrhizobium sp. B117 TaxID=3140246 RepID=UPI003182FDA3